MLIVQRFTDRSDCRPALSNKQRVDMCLGPRKVKGAKIPNGQGGFVDLSLSS